MVLSSRNIARFLILYLVYCSRPSLVASNVIRDMEESMEDGVGFVKTVATKIGNTFHQLSPRNQLIASGLTGFVVTRIVANSAYKAAKIGVAAYVAAEILHYSGALEHIKLSEEHSTIMNNVKETFFQQASNYRQQVHRRLNPGTIQTFVQRQRNAALGLAGGAFMGLVL
ncbi:hypothetical protein MPSEU_000483100 [Mayamaea pseudoterrestris]|nr:hypothetical protein MPSEU_000483100 [Mayamaea pseudoterrestris]